MAPNEKKQQEFDSVVQLERNEEVATVGVLAIQVLSYLRKKYYTFTVHFHLQNGISRAPSLNTLPL